MNILSQTHRGNSIRQDLKRKTMIEFIQNGEVIQGTFKLDKKNDMSNGNYIGVIDCWQINSDTVISLTII